MKIYFAVMCHNYQRRLCWTLSSILQQQHAPTILIDVACMRGNGNPSTERVLRNFGANGEGLPMRLSIIQDKKLFGYRGHVRNAQIRNALKSGLTRDDWIYFADADHVYAPDFFALLAHRLGGDLARESKCIYSYEKRHTNIDATNIAVDDSAAAMGDTVTRAYARAMDLEWRHDKISKNGAAGCMQVVRLGAILDQGGHYSPPRMIEDRPLWTGIKCKSDKRFRQRMGGSCRIRLPLQVHLDHHRDKESGKHIEEQR